MTTITYQQHTGGAWAVIPDATAAQVANAPNHINTHVRWTELLPATSDEFIRSGRDSAWWDQKIVRVVQPTP